MSVTENYPSSSLKPPLVMGIVNCTPDSFSGDGVIREKDHIESALQKVETLIEEGADIIDVGGESTRPGSPQVSVEEEMKRVLPVIKEIKRRFSIPVSIDTYKFEVAKEAVKEEVSFINCIKGLEVGPEYLSLMRDSGCEIILMHNLPREMTVRRSEFGTSYTGNRISKEEFISRLRDDLLSMKERAYQAGIDEKRLIIDPGFGFNKSEEENLWLLYNIQEIVPASVRTLIGISRKSFTGISLKLPPEKRVVNSIISTVLLMEKGFSPSIIRTHDVLLTKKAVDFYQHLNKVNAHG